VWKGLDGEFCKARKNLKKCMKLIYYNWNFRRGARGLEKNSNQWGDMDIFWNCMWYINLALFESDAIICQNFIQLKTTS